MKQTMSTFMALAMTSVVAWGAEAWRPAEFAFTALGTYEKPCVEVELSAVFKGPAGASYRVNGFWDGGTSWKVRFTPSAPGEWTYETACTVADTGLAGRKGAFTAQPATGENPLSRHGGILRISADHRYLTYSDGTPFFWLGGTWWFCPSDLVPIENSTKPGGVSMFKMLIDKRRDQGFTVVQMAFLGSMGKRENARTSPRCGYPTLCRRRLPAGSDMSNLACIILTALLLKTSNDAGRTATAEVIIQEVKRSSTVKTK